MSFTRLVPLVLIVITSTLLTSDRPATGQPADSDADSARAALLRQAGIPVDVSVKPASPRILAVRIRHRACPLCRDLEPRVAELMPRANELGVLFVTIDLSSEATQGQSALLASALGVESAWPDDILGTGTILFMTADGQRRLASIKSTSTEEIMAEMERAALMLPD